MRQQMDEVDVISLRKSKFWSLGPIVLGNLCLLVMVCVHCLICFGTESTSVVLCMVSVTELCLLSHNTWQKPNCLIGSSLPNPILG